MCWGAYAAYSYISTRAVAMVPTRLQVVSSAKVQLHMRLEYMPAAIRIKEVRILMNSLTHVACDSEYVEILEGSIGLPLAVYHLKIVILDHCLSIGSMFGWLNDPRGWFSGEFQTHNI